MMRALGKAQYPPRLPPICRIAKVGAPLDDSHHLSVIFEFLCRLNRYEALRAAVSCQENTQFRHLLPRRYS
jgi:hypothetical protein